MSGGRSFRPCQGGDRDPDRQVVAIEVTPVFPTITIMLGDLRFWRRRWWASYALIPLLLMTAFGMVAMAATRVAVGMWVSGLVGGLVALACLLGVIGLYAPWTGSWALRTLGALIGFGCVAFLGAAISSGNWRGSDHSAIAAMAGFVVIGILAFKAMATRRPHTSPYDDSGVWLGSTVLHELWPGPASSAEGHEEACSALTHVIADLHLPGVHAEVDMLVDIDEHPQVTVVVPRGPMGEHAWAEIQAELGRRGIPFSTKPPDQSMGRYGSLPGR